MTGPLLDAVARGVRVVELSHPLVTNMPGSPNHPAFRMTLIRRHGDVVRPDGGSASNELIVTGGHVGTHVDALAHVSQDGKLHGGIDAEQAQRGGLHTEHGAEQIPPMITRGVLLDVAATRGLPVLPGGLRRSARPSWRRRRSAPGQNPGRETSRSCAAAGRATSVTPPPTSGTSPACPASTRTARAGSPSGV